MPITLPSGGVIESEWIWPDADLSIQRRDFHVDLVVTNLSHFDVILGMDWLSSHHVRLDCGIPRISFRDSHGNYVSYRPIYNPPYIKFVSSISMASLINKGNVAYLCQVRDTRVIIPTLSSIPVVSNFPEVFPDEIPS